MKPTALWLLPPMAVGGALLLPRLASAFTPSGITQVGFSGDWASNYDFESTSYTINDNVDWPLTMIWGVQGEIDAVKDYLISSWGWTGQFCQWGGCDNYLNTNESSNANRPEWDDDSGVKGLCEEYGSYGLRNMHTRVYAPTDSPYYDRWYNPEFGYHIVGTTHYDINHNICDGIGAEQYGWSEDASDRIAYMASANFGVQVDNWGYYNAGYGWYPWDGGNMHYHESDGRAHFIAFK